MPSRYDDFVNAFNKMRQRVAEREQAHHLFADQIIAGLREHGQLPADGFQWMPLGKRGGRTGGRNEAVQFQDDGWLHAKFRLVTRNTGWVSALLRITEEGGAWVVMLGDKRYRMNQADEQARIGFYQGFFDAVVAELDGIKAVTKDREVEIGFGLPN